MSTMGRQTKIDILISKNYVDYKILESLSAHDVATVHEAMGMRGAMEFEIKPIVNETKMCGSAFTVKCHSGDNLMLIKAVNMARRGDVIVADMGNLVESGAFGELLAVESMTKGIAGLVVNCSVRDSIAIKRLGGFPVFSAGLSVCGTTKASLGSINYPIVCGGIAVKPGDIILGDNDGVVVVPLEEAEEVLKKANIRVEKEKVIMRRLKNGESLFDIYGYQKILDSLGCIEEQA